MMNVLRAKASTMNVPVITRVLTVLILAIAASGCQLVGGIFKAGVWVGILLVVVVIGLLFAVLGRARGVI